MISILHSLVLLLSFSLSVLATPTSIDRDTNAYRLSRGLPLKKPLNPFNATRTAAKRQQPSGAPQTGNYVVTYDNPARRKRSGNMYIAPSSAIGILTTTYDQTSAALIKTPGTGAFSDSTIQIYNPTTATWQYIYSPKLSTGPSGYDVSYITSSTAFSTYKQSASGVFGYNWVASDTQYSFTPQMYVGSYAGYTVVVGGYKTSDLTNFGITNIEPVTITFTTEVETNPCLGRKRC
ncbi:uncharacterized protein L199_005644 [Kwoniella botswanensis]|uniref:uncharacterized protein n=1 Tax=Kwoniella botswanensis TaxID=1268659 RepID=UPI00315D72FA